MTLSLFHLVPGFFLLWTIQAHNIVVEHEVELCAGEAKCLHKNLEPDNEGDSSFLSPQVQSQDRTDDGNSPFGIASSQAIFGYLNDENDVDAYDYEVTQQDVEAYSSRFGGVPIVLTPLLQACANTLSTYLSVAVIANPFMIMDLQGVPPTTMGPTGMSTLPEALREILETSQDGIGKTVLYTRDIPPESGIHSDRSVFRLEPLESEDLDLSWLLPYGCSIGPDLYPVCTPDARQIFAVAVAAGPVRVVVFFENSMPPCQSGIDYTLSIGLDEAHFLHDPEKEALVADDRHLINGCVAMDEEYDENACMTSSSSIHSVISLVWITLVGMFAIAVK